MLNKRNHRLLKALLMLGFAGALLLLPAPDAKAFSVYFQTFPQGTVGLAEPVIGMRISSADEFKTPNSYTLYLNGKEVPVQYDASRMEFSYTPDMRLSPGNYEAELIIGYNGYDPLQTNWSFTVAANAIQQLPATFSVEQQTGLSAVNDYRLVNGLAPLTMNAELTAAAQRHAEYLNQNEVDPGQVSLHEETSSLPGYIGATLLDRARFVGYTQGIGEDVSYHTGSLVESIDSLFDAPYHRTPFLDPGTQEIGIAKEGDYVVIEFGMEQPANANLQVSPAPGDAYVPVRFEGYESPDPLRLHTSNHYPVGYAILASLTGQDVTNVTDVTAKLTDSQGNNVQLLINTPVADDHLNREVILLPVAPLAYDSTYSASVSLNAVMHDGSVRTFKQQWSFHTEPSDGLGKKKLHAYAADYKRSMTADAGVKHTVSFGLDRAFYVLDNVTFPMNVKPYIENGSSYLWIRDLAAALGASVEWNDSIKAAVYTKNGRTVTFYTNRGVYAVNGVEQETDVPAKLINNNTMIPVRLLSEVLGAKVSYVDSTRTVTISY